MISFQPQTLLLGKSRPCCLSCLPFVYRVPLNSLANFPRGCHCYFSRPLNLEHSFSTHLESLFTSAECYSNFTGVAKQNADSGIQCPLEHSSVGEGGFFLETESDGEGGGSLHEFRLHGWMAASTGGWWPLLSKPPSRAVHQSELGLHSTTE